MRFVVIVEKEFKTRIVSFKKAEGDARAWGGYVEPITSKETFMMIERVRLTNG